MASLRVETLVIGDELLTGRVSDTNSTFIGDQLFNLGIIVRRHTVIADVIETIQSEILQCAKRANAVICFGGLGATSDDRTVEAVASLLKCEIIDDPTSKVTLLRRLKKLGRDVTPQTLKQVAFPSRMTALSNPVGTAPAFYGTIEGCQFYFLPGVPEEMMAIFLESLLPRFQSQVLESSQVHHVLWSCYDIAESELQRLLDPIEVQLNKNSWIGYRTSPPDNHVTLYTLLAKDSPEHSKIKQQIDSVLKPYVFSNSPVTLEELLLQQFEKKQLKIVFAESCTGGLCVQRMTRISGASKHIWGGFTTYQAGAKETMLSVKVADENAAVSVDCTRSLAAHALEVSGCDIAAAITGFLGPTGGNEREPIGTIYLCVADKSGFEERRVVLPPRTRERLQWAAATHLFHLIRKRLLFV